jgi:hypothetical protein
MRSLDSRLAILQRSAPAALEGFYEPHLKSFSVSPGSVSVRYYIVLLRLFAAPFQHSVFLSSAHKRDKYVLFVANDIVLRRLSAVRLLGVTER